MKIIAKTVKGKEFIYSKNTAHAVSDAAADYVLKVLNDNKYQLKNGEIWHVYNAGWYELEYTAAAYQKFTRRSGIVKECRY